MRQAKEKVIDGVQYTVSDLPPSQAFDLFVDLTKSIGPGAAPFLTSAFRVQALAHAANETQLDLFSIEKALTDLCVSLDKSVLRNAMKALAEVTFARAEPGSTTKCGNLGGRLFEEHFVGRFGAMMDWYLFALTAQYGDFISSLLDKGTTGQARDQTPVP